MRCELRSREEYYEWYLKFKRYWQEVGKEILAFLTFCLYLGWIVIGIFGSMVLTGIYLSGNEIADPWYVIMLSCGPGALFLMRLPLVLICRNKEIIPGARFLLSHSN